MYQIWVTDAFGFCTITLAQRIPTYERAHRLLTELAVIPPRGVTYQIRFAAKNINN